MLFYDNFNFIPPKVNTDFIRNINLLIIIMLTIYHNLEDEKVIFLINKVN